MGVVQKRVRGEHRTMHRTRPFASTATTPVAPVPFAHTCSEPVECPRNALRFVNYSNNLHLLTPPPTTMSTNVRAVI